MSTRSNIVFKRILKDDFRSIRSVYCHYDGYPGFKNKGNFVPGVGYELLNHFNSQSKVNEIKLKSMRSIDSTIEYMGEKEEYDSYEDISQYFRMTQGDVFIEYIYYWDGVQWMISELESLKLDKNKYEDKSVSVRTKFRPLSIVIDEIAGSISPNE